MTELITKAIDKIDKEAEGAGEVEKRIAQHILDELIGGDENAEKILAENKTLTGCVNEIRDKAQKSAGAGKSMAMVEDAQVWAWVRQYYGIKAAGERSEPKGVAVNLADFM